MLQSGAIIGGEQSGHIIFRTFLSTGDGMLSALQILGIMKETGKPLSELSSLMTKYPQVLVNTRVLSKIPLESLPVTAGMIREAESRLQAEGRVLVRYSGTENLLRVMVEGRDKDVIHALANGIAEAAKKEIESAAGNR
jgi:phosphoglucosamine mutase